MLHCRLILYWMEDIPVKDLYEGQHSRSTINNFLQSLPYIVRSFRVKQVVESFQGSSRRVRLVLYDKRWNEGTGTIDRYCLIISSHVIDVFSGSQVGNNQTKQPLNGAHKTINVSWQSLKCSLPLLAAVPALLLTG